MMLLMSTARCGRTPDVALALEELGLTWSYERVGDGFFTERYGRPGPLLRHGELELFEPAAIIRHLGRQASNPELWPSREEELTQAEQWMDFAISQVRPAVARLMGMQLAGIEGPMLAEETKRLGQALSLVERAVTGREYLLGRFTLADCAFTALSLLPRLRHAPSGLTALSAYAQRLAARPAAKQAAARLGAGPH